jgi:hypothetical protein
LLAEAVAVLSRADWIPAFAGMTKGGGDEKREIEKPSWAEDLRFPPIANVRPPTTVAKARGTARGPTLTRAKLMSRLVGGFAWEPVKVDRLLSGPSYR